MPRRFYHNKPQVWDAKKCHRAARHRAKDGLGTKYPFLGYIGNHYGRVEYNGGIVIEDKWYKGQVFPLPEIAPGYKLIRKPTWGWQIIAI